MNSFIVCLLAAFLCSSIVFAQKTTSQDSFINQTDFKHNKQYFLDHYGTDDSTRALINTFFRVRRAAAMEVGYSVVAGIGLYIFVDHVFGPGENKSNT